MAKQPAQQKQTEDKLPLWRSNMLTFYSEPVKKNLTGSLELSVQDVHDNWDKVDYGVLAAVFEDDEVGVKKLMKGFGYYLLNPKPMNGCYVFQHYTNKKKQDA